MSNLSCLLYCIKPTSTLQDPSCSSRDNLTTAAQICRLIDWFDRILCAASSLWWLADFCLCLTKDLLVLDKTRQSEGVHVDSSPCQNVFLFFFFKTKDVSWILVLYAFRLTKYTLLHTVCPQLRHLWWGWALNLTLLLMYPSEPEHEEHNT